MLCRYCLEPVGRDTFIASRELGNVVRLVARERAAVVVPARAA